MIIESTVARIENLIINDVIGEINLKTIGHCDHPNPVVDIVVYSPPGAIICEGCELPSVADALEFAVRVIGDSHSTPIHREAMNKVYEDII